MFIIINSQQINGQSKDHDSSVPGDLDLCIVARPIPEPWLSSFYLHGQCFQPLLTASIHYARKVKMGDWLTDLGGSNAIWRDMIQIVQIELGGISHH